MKQAGENLFSMLPSVWQSLSLLFLSLFVAIVVIAHHVPEKVAHTRNIQLEIKDDARYHNNLPIPRDRRE